MIIARTKQLTSSAWGINRYGKCSGRFYSGMVTLKKTYRHNQTQPRSSWSQPSEECYSRKYPSWYRTWQYLKWAPHACIWHVSFLMERRNGCLSSLIQLILPLNRRLCNREEYRKEGYSDVKEPKPADGPTPRWRRMVIRVFVDSDHDGKTLTRRSYTAYLVKCQHGPDIMAFDIQQKVRDRWDFLRIGIRGAHCNEDNNWSGR